MFFDTTNEITVNENLSQAVCPENNLQAEEIFSVEKCNEQQVYTLVNARVDYQYRGRELEHLCLYEYVSSIYRKKMDATDKCYFDKHESTIEQHVCYEEILTSLLICFVY